MRKAWGRGAFWIALLVAGGLCGSSLFGQTASQRGFQEVNSPPAPSLQTGPYYALVIGNNNYKYLPKLKTSINDAKDVAQLLRERYAFTTKLLLDADRNQILTALIEYRQTLPENSNLLIYYAGHGHHDRETDEAYWLPVDALEDNNANWISADDITRGVRAIPSAHVLVISDSCYSGFLSRGADAAINPRGRAAILANALKSKSRTLMSSGGDEPVADSGAPGHSVFAWAILESLRRIDEDEFTASELLNNFIKPGVAGRSGQLPEYSELLQSGHEWGDFVFSRVPTSGSSSSEVPPVPPAGGILLPSLDPATRTFIVDRDITALAANGTGCQLSVGDVLTRLTDTPDANWRVNASVSASKKGDCAGGQTVAIKIYELHEMFDKFQDEVDTGLGELGRSLKGPETLPALDPALRTFIVDRDITAVGKDGKKCRLTEGDALTRLTDTPDTNGTVNASVAASKNGECAAGQAVAVKVDDLQEMYKNLQQQLDAGMAELATKASTSGGPPKRAGKDSATPRRQTQPQGAVGWIVGSNDTILHSEDGGVTWKAQTSHTGATLTSVDFATPLSGWAVGYVVGEGAILHTEDGGNSWKPQNTSTIPGLYSVAFATPQSGWAVGVRGTILHTENGGATWQWQSSANISGLPSVFFATPQLGWVASWSGQILHTEDGGRTWTQASGSAKDLISVAFVTTRSGWAVGVDGVILHSGDGGATWQKQNSGTTAGLYGVAFVTPQSGWTAGQKGTILHTEDGGSTWVAQSSGITVDLFSIALVSPESGWAVGQGGTILHTENGGLTWKPQSGGTNESLNSVTFVQSQ